MMKLQKYLLLTTLLFIATASIGDPHISLMPGDYTLKNDLTLNSGKVIKAGTEWYRAPNITHLQNELKEGNFKGDKKWAEQIVFGYNIITHTYFTIGDGRKDGRP